MSELSDRLNAVQAAIADAAHAADRSPDELTLIVVTKFHPASLVQDLYDLGVRNVGENRHQEAQAKAAELAGLDPRVLYDKMRRFGLRKESFRNSVAGRT